jgi:hypothetical protein
MGELIDADVTKIAGPKRRHDRTAAPALKSGDALRMASSQYRAWGCAVREFVHQAVHGLLLPTTTEVPDIEIGHVESRSTTNPSGY